MRQCRHKYIYLTSLALLMAGACSDDLLYDTGADPTDPNAVKYSASVGRAFEVSTRGAEESEYEPLIATADDGSTKLYLHTYETDKIGERPGEDDQPSTRGYQVTSVDELVKYHKDFFVHAQYTDNGEEYIGWVKAKAQTAGSNIWLSDKTEYWPAGNQLSFHAVAPSSELGNMESASFVADNMSFSYSALKGNGTNDAQTQKDLLVATSSCNKEGSVQGKAPLQFHHALSSIKFAIRDVMGGTVKNIKITGVYGTGRCVYSADKSGDNGKFTWTVQSNSKQSYGQDFNYTIPDRIVGDLNSDAEDLKMYQDLPEHTFMLIPQLIPDDAMVEITIQFDKTSDMAGYTKVLKARIKDNLVTEWKAGHEYVYTISTSGDNWVYVFEATGNHISPAGAKAIPDFNNGNHSDVKDDNDYTAGTNTHGDNDQCNILGDMIYVFSPSRDRHDLYNDDAYFRVRSFRYRANNHKVVEDLSWNADYDLRGEQWREVEPNTFEYVTKRDLESDMSTTWITDISAVPFKGDGDHSDFGELHKITMAPHHQLTDWPGDKWMDDNAEYIGTSKEKPWDLSTFGGKKNMYTANCYVIDRSGWYSFPLYYGSAIKNGSVVSTGFKYTGSYTKCLADFTDYQGSAIPSTGKIPSSQAVSADVVWADVYNAVSDVEIIGSGNNKRIRFKANKGNMQQGNVVIALYDSSNKVVWSWHIWINEHWLDPTTGLPDAIQNTTSGFAFEKAEKSGWRQRGDVQIEVGSSKRYMAAYNLGWCDPKNVDYLRRAATLTFIQKRPDGKITTLTLPVIQDGERIEYKYGNNTYYQFGRKDPMVGFVDHENEIKRNFGPKQYALGTQPVTIQKAIQEPNVLYCKGGTNDDDWVSYSYHNLWNNDSSHDPMSETANAVVKTVYDPCPAGYVVPPSYMLRFIGSDDNGSFYNSNSKNAWPPVNFNGYRVYDEKGVADDYTFKVKRNSSATADADMLWLTSTGNRWYCSTRPELAKAGDNFNPNLVYLWSCNPRSTRDVEANGIAFGLDKSNGQNGGVITPYFQGRRSMARPVRPVRE